MNKLKHTEKEHTNQKLSVSNTLQEKSNRASCLEFENNREESATQRRLQCIADNSSKNQQLNKFQHIVNNATASQSIRKKENHTGLPDNLKFGIENLYGQSMDDVKVHYNSPKPTPLQAHAYAQGTDIHASGQEKHLSYEAWHVVEQKQGRVTPTMQMMGSIQINDDAGLENEATKMGNLALAIHLNDSGENIQRQHKSSSGLTGTAYAENATVVQGVFNFAFQVPNRGDMPDNAATRLFKAISETSNITSLVGKNDVYSLTSLRDMCARWLQTFDPNTGGDGSAYQRGEVDRLYTTVKRELDSIDSRAHGTGDAFSRDTDDLLYGTHANRMHYEPQLGVINQAFGGGGGGLMGAPHPIQEPLIADFMNNLFLGTGVGQQYGQQQAQTPQIAPNNKVFQDYVFFFERYFSASIPRGAGALNESTRIATACKFGVWLTAKQGRTIRFILDDIDTKDRQQQIASGAATQFTARELRFIRSSWHDNDIRKNVKFYLHGREVLPPWETYATQWTGFSLETIALPDEAETEVTATAKIGQETNDLKALANELSEIKQQSSEKIEMINLLTAEAAELRLANTPSMGDDIKIFFGIGSDKLEQMKKNLQKAAVMMAESRKLIQEVQILNAHAQHLIQAFMLKINTMKKLVTIAGGVDRDKQQFIANPPMHLPRRLFG